MKNSLNIIKQTSLNYYIFGEKVMSSYYFKEKLNIYERNQSKGYDSQ